MRSGVGHHLSADHSAGCVAVPLSGGRCMEPLTWPQANVPEALAGGLGCGRGGVG